MTNSKSTRRVYFVLHARFFVSALIQGSNQSNAFWDFVCGIIKDPSPEQEACHAPKPILLDTGEMHWPYDWHPRIIDTQLLKVGQFAIAAVPGEFTTMSGRSVKTFVVVVVVISYSPSMTAFTIPHIVYCNHVHYIHCIGVLQFFPLHRRQAFLEPDELREINCFRLSLDV